MIHCLTTWSPNLACAGTSPSGPPHPPPMSQAMKGRDILSKMPGEQEEEAVFFLGGSFLSERKSFFPETNPPPPTPTPPTPLLSHGSKSRHSRGHWATGPGLSQGNWGSSGDRASHLHSAHVGAGIGGNTLSKRNDLLAKEERRNMLANHQQSSCPLEDTTQEHCVGCPRAAATNDRRPVAENKRHVFSPGSGGQKSKMTVSPGPCAPRRL